MAEREKALCELEQDFLASSEARKLLGLTESPIFNPVFTELDTSGLFYHLYPQAQRFFQADVGFSKEDLERPNVFDGINTARNVIDEDLLSFPTLETKQFLTTDPEVYGEELSHKARIIHSLFNSLYAKVMFPEENQYEAQQQAAELTDRGIPNFQPAYTLKAPMHDGPLLPEELLFLLDSDGEQPVAEFMDGFQILEEIEKIMDDGLAKYPNLKIFTGYTEKDALRMIQEVVADSREDFFADISERDITGNTVRVLTGRHYFRDNYFFKDFDFADCADQDQADLAASLLTARELYDQLQRDDVDEDIKELEDVLCIKEKYYRSLESHVSSVLSERLQDTESKIDRSLRGFVEKNGGLDKLNAWDFFSQVTGGAEWRDFQEEMRLYFQRKNNMLIRFLTADQLSETDAQVLIKGIKKYFSRNLEVYHQFVEVSAEEFDFIDTEDLLIDFSRLIGEIFGKDIDWELLEELTAKRVSGTAVFQDFLERIQSGETYIHSRHEAENISRLITDYGFHENQTAELEEYVFTHSPKKSGHIKEQREQYHAAINKVTAPSRDLSVAFSNLVEENNLQEIPVVQYVGEKFAEFDELKQRVLQLNPKEGRIFWDKFFEVNKEHLIYSLTEKNALIYRSNSWLNKLMSEVFERPMQNIGLKMGERYNTPAVQHSKLIEDLRAQLTMDAVILFLVRQGVINEEDLLILNGYSQFERSWTEGTEFDPSALKSGMRNFAKIIASAVPKKVKFAGPDVLESLVKTKAVGYNPGLLQKLIVQGKKFPLVEDGIVPLQVVYERERDYSRAIYSYWKRLGDLPRESLLGQFLNSGYGLSFLTESSGAKAFQALAGHQEYKRNDGELFKFRRYVRDVMCRLVVLDGLIEIVGDWEQLGVPFTFAAAQENIHFQDLYPMHLLTQLKDQVEPNDISLSPDRVLTLIGAAGSGKTVTLKAVTQAALHAQLGFPISAEQAELEQPRIVFLSLNDDHSDNRGSRFANQAETLFGFMDKIEQNIQESDRPIIIGLDELFRGTDDINAAALIWAFLENLNAQQQVYVASATHFMLLKDLVEAGFINFLDFYSVEPGTHQLTREAAESELGKRVLPENGFTDSFLRAFKSVRQEQLLSSPEINDCLNGVEAYQRPVIEAAFQAGLFEKVFNSGLSTGQALEAFPRHNARKLRAWLFDPRLAKENSFLKEQRKQEIRAGLSSEDSAELRGFFESIVDFIEAEMKVGEWKKEQILNLLETEKDYPGYGGVMLKRMQSFFTPEVVQMVRSRMAQMNPFGTPLKDVLNLMQSPTAIDNLGRKLRSLYVTKEVFLRGILDCSSYQEFMQWLRREEESALEKKKIGSTHQYKFQEGTYSRVQKIVEDNWLLLKTFTQARYSLPDQLIAELGITKKTFNQQAAASDSKEDLFKKLFAARKDPDENFYLPNNFLEQFLRWDRTWEEFKAAADPFSYLKNKMVAAHYGFQSTVEEVEMHLSLSHWINNEELGFTEVERDTDQIYIENGYYPGLRSRFGISEQDIVRNTVKLRPGEPLIFTGDNNAGKTMTLKMILFNALTAWACDYAVGDYVEIPDFDTILGLMEIKSTDEQSSSMYETNHLARMLQTVEEREGKALVLFDELGSTVSSDEGSALAALVLRMLAEKDCFVGTTTHYHQLRERIEACFPDQKTNPYGFVFGDETNYVAIRGLEPGTSRGIERAVAVLNEMDLEHQQAVEQILERSKALRDVVSQMVKSKQAQAD